MQALRIPVDALRIVAVVLIVLSGLVMLVPKLREGFELLASRIASRRPRARPGAADGGAGERGWGGFWGGGLVGLSLALTRRIDGGSVYITLAYSLGTAIPMLAVMFGGRALLNKVPALARNAANIPRQFSPRASGSTRRACSQPRAPPQPRAGRAAPLLLPLMSFAAGWWSWTSGLIAASTACARSPT